MMVNKSAPMRCSLGERPDRHADVSYARPRLVAVSTDIELVISVPTLLATRSYDQILRTRRYGPPEDDLAVIGDEVIVGWRQYVVARSCGYDFHPDHLDGMSGEQAHEVLVGWLAQFHAAQIYPPRVWAAGSSEEKAPVYHREYVEVLDRLITRCAENRDATVRIS